MDKKEIYLVLADGTVYTGKSFGAVAETMGEVVFTTGMTGYLETLTDPSYYGQIVVQTFPLIGNYGVIPSDFESKGPHLKGYIVREWCETPSNFRAEGTLDAFLKERNIVGLYDIDTRSLTRRLRSHGVMNGAIVASKDKITDELLDTLKNFRVVDAVPSVSPQESVGSEPSKKKYKVALWDFGAKAYIERQLLDRGCDVVRVDCHAKAEDIVALNVDGVLLSNGPVDPADNPEVVVEVGRWLERKMPTLGICLGHQLMALSQGIKTEKLKYGHRGANQPVRELPTGKVFITSQNHGYAVSTRELPPYISPLFENVNDGTCEGLTYQGYPAFSVQFHPEAAGGPLDTTFLFDRFIAMMGGNSDAAKK